MERSVGALLVAVVCGMTIPGAGGAQERVRVTLGDSEMVVGMVERITPEAITLSLPRGGSRVVAPRDVIRIETRTARRQWRRGLFVGAAVGGVFGLWPFLWAPYSEDLPFKAFLWSNYVVVCGGVGSAVGGLIRWEGWETVRDWRSRPMTPGLLIGTHAMASGDSRVLLGARVRF